MRKPRLLQKLLYPVSLHIYRSHIAMLTSSLVTRCAIWRGVHGSVSCPIYSVLSLVGWSDSLSRALGRSWKRCLTSPGSVGSHMDTPQTCILRCLRLSYHPCLVPAARGMWPQRCYVHDSTWLLRKQSHFSGSPKRLRRCLESRVWENFGLVGKNPDIIPYAPAEQNTNLCRNLVWPPTHKRADHED